LLLPTDETEASGAAGGGAILTSMTILGSTTVSRRRE
jgi:hypothetical protein